MSKPTRMVINPARQLATAEQCLGDLKGLAFRPVPPRPRSSPEFDAVLKKWRGGAPVPEDMQSTLEQWLACTVERVAALEEVKRRLRILFWMHDVFVRNGKPDNADRVADCLRTEWHYLVPDQGITGVNESGDCMVEVTIAEMVKRSGEARSRHAA